MHLKPLLLSGICLFAAAAQAQEVPSVSPPTDTVLPRSGVDPTAPSTSGDLFSGLGQTQASPRGVSAPNLQIHGSIDVSEEYTTDVGAAAGAEGVSRGSDFLTQIQPGLMITDTSQRLQVNLDYHPIGQIYAENFDFSQLEQQGSGAATATLLPGWLYFDLRGSISQQSVFGGVGPGTVATLSPNQREQVSSFAVSPYLSHTLGGTGTVQAGVSYSESATDGPGLGNAFANPLLEQLLGNPRAYGSSTLGTERAYTNFTTGENYGRLQDKAGIDASYYTGNGAQSGGRRVLVTDDISYAYTRLVTLLGEVGYENLNYPRSQFAYAGPIGSGGVKLTPFKGSSITLEYRYVDGFGSLYAQGSVQATPRVRVFGGYSEGISTEDQDLQDSLFDGSSETGVAASALQAAPLLSTNGSFAGNQNLNHLKRLDLTATYENDYDTVSIAIHRETTMQVGVPVFNGFGVPFLNSANIQTNGTFGSVNEVHLLTPTITLNGYVQYGSNQSGAAGNASGDTVSFSAGVDKSFQQNIGAYLRFNGTYFVGGSAVGAAGTRGLSGDQTNVVLGVRKTF